PTPWANFRVDFALRLGDRVVVLECDGAEFHDPSRDEWRDAAILGQGLAQTVYRFRGTDIWHCLNDCLWLLAFWEQPFFTERARESLERLRNVSLPPKPPSGGVMRCWTTGSLW